MLLYKYYPDTVLSEEMRYRSLYKKEFYFSSVEQLNDPFDLYGGRAVVYQHKLLRRWLGETYDVYDTLRKKELSMLPQKDANQYIILTFLSFLQSAMQYASCSFSRVPLERLMWAHYASSHHGICLGFEFPQDTDIHKVLYVDKLPWRDAAEDSMQDSIQQGIEQYCVQLVETKIKLADFTSMFPSQAISKAMSKEYKDKQTFLDSIMKYFKHRYIGEDGSQINELLEGLPHLPLPYNDISDPLHIKDLLCLKSQEWCYEQEERLIDTIATEQKGECKPWAKGVELKQIILGCRFNTKDESRMKKIHDLQKLCGAELYTVDASNIKNFELCMKPYRK